VRALLDQDSGNPSTASLAGESLATWYAFPKARAWLRASMVASLDGAVGGTDGRSGSINTAADRQVFAMQRDLCDVVLVGAGTARIEEYHRVTATPRSPEPAVIAVVTRSGRVPETLLDAPTGSGDLLVITCAGVGREAIGSLTETIGQGEVLVCGEDEVDLVEVVSRLADRGLGHILCEGGPTLLGAAFAAGVVDEFALTFAPAIVAGDAARIVSGTLPDGASEVRMTLRHLLEEDSTLLGLWRVLR
jgi:riboflavin biosynthesis pyrimidine reductase